LNDGASLGSWDVLVERARRQQADKCTQVQSACVLGETRSNNRMSVNGGDFVTETRRMNS
jgi:hypothetical protein